MQKSARIGLGRLLFFTNPLVFSYRNTSIGLTVLFDNDPSDKKPSSFDFETKQA